MEPDVDKAVAACRLLVEAYKADAAAEWDKLDRAVQVAIGISVAYKLACEVLDGKP